MHIGISQVDAAVTGSVHRVIGYIYPAQPRPHSQFFWGEGGGATGV